MDLKLRLHHSSLIPHHLPQQGVDVFDPVGENKWLFRYYGCKKGNSHKIKVTLDNYVQSYCELSSSWINFSRSLKQPSEQIEFSISVSTADIVGIIWNNWSLNMFMWIFHSHLHAFEQLPSLVIRVPVHFCLLPSPMDVDLFQWAIEK